ncbi:hypothetical protein GVAV_002247 [Gurleya vavrai]
MNFLLAEFEKYAIDYFKIKEGVFISDFLLNYYIRDFINSKKFKNIFFPPKNLYKPNDSNPTVESIDASQTIENVKKQSGESFSVIPTKDISQTSRTETTREQILRQPPKLANSSKVTEIKSKHNINMIFNATYEYILKYQTDSNKKFSKNFKERMHEDPSFDIKNYNFLNETEQKDLNKFVLNLIIKNYDTSSDVADQVFKNVKEICEEFFKNDHSNFRISDEKYNDLKMAFSDYNYFHHFSNNKLKTFQSLKEYALSVTIVKKFFDQLLDYINLIHGEDSYLKSLEVDE